MTLDEAIKHAQDEANRLRSEECFDCADDHQQLAEWLIELKTLQNINKTKHGE
tara:strand:- start:254 stop:412 length:159 start_codon:yes stop_codon:yes gene_type:complete